MALSVTTTMNNLRQVARDHPYTVIISLTAIGTVLVISIHNYKTKAQKTLGQKNWDTISANREIISCRTPHQPNPRIEEKLLARSTPNQRLKIVFGIDNAFTTFEPQRREEFRHEARVSIARADFVELATIAKKILMQKVDILEKSTPLTDPVYRRGILSEIAQELTLKLTLKVFLNCNAANLNDQAIMTVTREINRLWIISKTEPFDELPQFEHNRDLRSALEVLVPQHNSDDANQNALNFVIPAYETVWRVALLGFLECQHHVSGAAEELFAASKEALKAFLNDPAQPQTPTKVEVHFTAFDIARETLRLYPSTKSVYRSLHVDESRSGIPSAIHKIVFGPSKTGIPMAHRANVESLHRLKDDVWEDDSTPVTVQQFYPQRWLGDRSNAMKMAYVPFGLGDISCPAQKDFGNRIVALLISTLAQGLAKYEIRDADRGHGPLIQPRALPSGREDLERWYVFRPSELGLREKEAW